MINGEKKSKTISGTFTKKPNDYAITLHSTYTPQYHAGGPDGLLDGIFGTENWKKGDWQGYFDQDFEAVIDLGKAKSISEVDAHFLQDSRSWIMMPTKMEIYTSTNKEVFKLAGVIEKDANPFNDSIFTDHWKVQFQPQKIQYIKVKVYNYGAFPKGHLAEPFQGKSYIFVDEITIK